MPSERPSYSGNYLVHLQGKVLGPFKAAHLATLVRNGIYPHDVMVQRPDDDEVFPFYEVNPSGAPKHESADDIPAAVSRVPKVTMKSVLSPPSAPSPPGQESRGTPAPPPPPAATSLPRPALSPPSMVPPMPSKVNRQGQARKAKQVERPKWVAPATMAGIVAVLAVVALLSKQAIKEWWTEDYPDMTHHPLESVSEAVDEALLSDAMRPTLRPPRQAPVPMPVPPPGQRAIFWQENGAVYFVPSLAADGLQGRVKHFELRRQAMMESLRKIAAETNEVRRLKPVEDQPSPSEMNAYKLRVRRVSDTISREWAQVKALVQEMDRFTEELERAGTKAAVGSAK